MNRDDVSASLSEVRDAQLGLHDHLQWGDGSWAKMTYSVPPLLSWNNPGKVGSALSLFSLLLLIYPNSHPTRWQSRTLSVVGRMASTIMGPMVMLGTNLEKRATTTSDVVAITAWFNHATTKMPRDTCNSPTRSGHLPPVHDVDVDPVASCGICKSRTKTL